MKKGTKMMNRKQAGFTLIELVVVITIIAILAAVALPKFTNLQRDARIAKLNAARGAVGAAAALIHGTYLPRAGVADPAASTPCVGTNALSGTLCTESGLIQLANGYPASATALGAAVPGIVGAAGLVSVFSPTLAQLNAEGFNVTVGATASIQVTGGTNAANCSFTYAAPTVAGAAPVIGAAVTTGC